VDARDRPEHEIVEGSSTLKDLAVGEAMHSAIGAWTEANAVYVAQAGLERLARDATAHSPVTLYDLGLGIGANALAAISEYRSFAPAPARGLRILSFESKLSGLETALAAGATRFPFLAGHEGALRALLEKRAYRSEDNRVEWSLHEGDFGKLPLSGRPLVDIIFFDFFSPKASPELWSPSVFARLRDLSPDGILITYSAATRARAAMLLGGWSVGEGEPTSLKAQTTLAASRPGKLSRPLGREWLERFRRSGSKLPHGYAGNEESLLAAIERMPQFS
jgi:tRNA U34 5-methylaminomethyl-2-thiouridine-forming methyltransferase MnmC